MFTASFPPHLKKVFCKMAHVPEDILIVRASTDRPVLGYHFITTDVHKVSIYEATRRLAFALESSLGPDERIIIFFKDHFTADRFAAQTSCAVFHSQLPSAGKTKAYNLWLWDTGQTKVMAATTALIQGTDRPYIKYVIFADVPYGAISYQQGGGRGGRAGEFAYVITIFGARTVYMRERARQDLQVLDFQLS